uniref:Uncharacterized protein n=1 Tax=Anguilla anguilla TaxID=7936 RepID=A0A0E9X985_ANGAN
MNFLLWLKKTTHFGQMIILLCNCPPLWPLKNICSFISPLYTKSCLHQISLGMFSVNSFSESISSRQLTFYLKFAWGWI